MNKELVYRNIVNLINNGFFIDKYIELRKKKGYSQEKIADITGIARTNIVRIESKKNMPTLEILLRLANALDMELEINFVERHG